jgi:hypothetical protein
MVQLVGPTLIASTASCYAQSARMFERPEKIG